MTRDLHYPEALRASLPDFGPGEVALVGAGPGDPSLLTIRALHFLSLADVILYDTLVDTAVLQLAPASARTEHVGKRAGGPSCSQRFIHRRLLTLTRRGDRVVRLKGGDPLVFGRGGEEALELAAAGVRCHFVPGITAGIGGLTAAGIPLTQRDVNQGAIFLTGSDGRGELPSHNWKALATSQMPLIVYMGFRRRRDIATRLLQAGARRELSTAVIFDATGPRQEVREQSLAELARDQLPGPTAAPALLVIGATVGLRGAMLEAMGSAAQADLNGVFSRHAAFAAANA